MPFVHVRALPLDGDVDRGAAVRAVSAEVARAAEVDEEHEEHMTVTWHTLAPDHYASSGRTATIHSRRTPLQLALEVGDGL
jgi:hypothetical protein